MSNQADDDIWAGVREDSAINAGKMMAATASLADRLENGLGLRSSELSLGALEKRDVAQETQIPEFGATKLAWDKTSEEPDGPLLGSRKRKVKGKPVPFLLIGSIVVSLLWLAGSSLFVFQNIGANGTDGTSLIFSMLVIVLGTSFALLAGFMGESVSRSSRESRRLLSAARRLLDNQPAGSNKEPGTLVSTIAPTGQIETLLSEVSARLKTMEARLDTLNVSPSMVGSSSLIGESSDSIATVLEQERQRLDTLIGSLNELTRRAQTSVAEAGQEIEDRAGKIFAGADTLATKSGLASQIAQAAAERLEAAAQHAVVAIEQLDQAAGRGEAALARAHDLMVLARVRADEAIGHVGTAVASFHDAATSATETASAVSETILNEAEATRQTGLLTLDEVREAALANAQLISESLRQEAMAAQEAGAETLAALQASADAVRFATEEARELAYQQVTDTQRQVELVRQTASEASQEADAFMATRVNEARDMIEASVGLLDETGTRIQERFGRLAAACADQARAVEDLLDGLDRRLCDLPVEADARAKAIEAALTETLERLTIAGKKAAAETAALDVAFQDRLRESYSALGEVVSRLGGLSGVLPMPVAPMGALPIKAPTPVAPEAPPSSAVAAAEPEAEMLQPLATEPVVEPPQSRPARPNLARPNLARPSLGRASLGRASPLASAAKALTPKPPTQSESPAPQPMSRAAPTTAQAGASEQKPVPRVSFSTLPSGLQNPVPEATDAEAIDNVQAAPAATAVQGTPPLPAPAPPNTSIERPNRLRITSPIPVEDDPFADLQLDRARPLPEPDGPAPETNWSWKQVLSNLDETSNKTSANRISDLVDELELPSALPDKSLEKLRVLATRSRDQARKGTRELVRDEVRAMRRKLTSDPTLRASVVRFVESRKEAAAKGRLSGNPARVYFVADAALEA